MKKISPTPWLILASPDPPRPATSGSIPAKLGERGTSGHSVIRTFIQVETFLLQPVAHAVAVSLQAGSLLTAQLGRVRRLRGALSLRSCSHCEECGIAKYH
jgi:hypothetical protein